MSLIVTGATGQLGRQTVEQLLSEGIPAAEIVATGREISRLEGFAARGVSVRHADFSDQATLESAFAGADRLLLVSTTDLDQRYDNHRRAIDAARAAGVGQVIYVSMVNAESAGNRLAVEHLRTEDYLRSSGVPFVVLRNGWYLENYTQRLEEIVKTGVLVGSAQNGRVSAASRRDYAEAAAVVLIQEGHAGRVYELGGEPFTLSELTSAITDQTGSDVVYRDVSKAEFEQLLTESGLPPELAGVLADSDAGLARNELFTDSDQLASLIGRPATTLADAIRVSLAGHEAPKSRREIGR